MDWDRRRGGKSLGIRVWVNVDLPLWKGQMLAVAGRASCNAVFKYEKLYDLCFRCGKFDHLERGCLAEGINDKVPYRLGPWMRASSGGYDGGRNR